MTGGQGIDASVAFASPFPNSVRKMTSPVTIENGKMYGHRARIGYTSPPLTTEIFPYEFYKIVPDGVSLVVTSLAIVVRSKDEVDQSYDISMRAAREMAAAGCDIVHARRRADQPLARHQERRADDRRSRSRDRDQGVVERGRAGEGRQGARLQEGRGGAALRPFRHRPHRRLFRALRLRAARRHRLGQRVQPHRRHPAARRGRDGPQADEGASRTPTRSSCRRRTGRPPAPSTCWRRSSAST